MDGFKAKGRFEVACEKCVGCLDMTSCASLRKEKKRTEQKAVNAFEERVPERGNRSFANGVTFALEICSGGMGD